MDQQEDLRYEILTRIVTLRFDMLASLALW